jgi:ABC-2 type transport system permease protein
VSVAPYPQQGRVRSVLDFYVTMLRTSISAQFQYRAASYFYMLGMVAEPVIYLVVWTTIAKSQGGSVNGITAGQFAAYFIVWTLVRNMNVVFGAPYWEWRIREGELSGQLLRPLHPINYDIGWFAASKVVNVVLWLPIAAVLIAVFHPTLHPSALQIVVFFFAIWGAYFLRTFIQSTIGMLNFWTTRGAAFFDLYMAAELLLSGRLVPLKLMPGWVQTLSNFFPFKWTFFFPIDALAGNPSNQTLLLGLAAQFGWIAGMAILFRFAWNAAIKRFSAVGG